MQSEWMDVLELSETLRIKPKTLYRMAAEGRIPSYKLGGLLRFKRAEIDGWIEGRRRPSGAAGDPAPPDGPQPRAARPSGGEAADFVREVVRRARGSFAGRDGRIGPEREPGRGD